MLNTIPQSTAQPVPSFPAKQRAGSAYVPSHNKVAMYGYSSSANHLNNAVANNAPRLPKANAQENREDVMAYAGMFSGVWCQTPQQTDAVLNQLHDEWNR